MSERARARFNSIEPRRRRPREMGKPGNTRQIIERAQALGATYGRCDHRVELIEPLRQLPV